MGGPVDAESFSDNTSYSNNREKRAEVIRSRLKDLPASGEIEAELSFPGVEGLKRIHRSIPGRMKLSLLTRHGWPSMT